MRNIYRAINLSKLFLVASLLILFSGCGGGGGSDNDPDTPPSNDANLSGLSVTAGNLNPVFSSNNTNYSVNGITQDSIRVIATLADANASIRINGNSATSGQLSPQINLSIGTNVIDIEVTAEDGTTQKVYTVTVNRIGTNMSNADLSSMVMNAGDLNPIFDPAVTSYSAQVTNSINSITFTATTSVSGASMTINGNSVMSGVESILFNLNVGVNTFNVEVTSEDGQVVKTYIISVVRISIGSNADLSNLTLGDATLNEKFAPDVILYTADASFLTTSIRFYPVVVDGNAVILIDNQAVNSGELSHPVSLAEGQNMIDIVVTSGDGLNTKTYTVIVTREDVNQFAQTVFIKSNSGRSQSFGGAGGPVGTLSQGVDIDGDTMVIGVSFDDSPNPSQVISAIYIYDRIDGVWAFQQRFTDPLGLQFFGASVDIDGDTIVVSQPNGVRGIAPNYVASGAVHVFTRSGGVWAFDQIIEPNELQAQLFGASIDLEGDTLVVGSPWLIQDVSGLSSFAGGVYVFTRSGSSWTQQAIITSSNIDLGDSFGAQVALYGNTLVATAPGERSISTGINGDEDDNSLRGGSGAAYIFTGSGSSWTQEAYLKSDVVTERYAHSVDVHDDTVVVSSPRENKVYVYSKTRGQWAKQAVVQPDLSGFGYSPFFGAHLDLYKDTLVVGAPNNASGDGGFNGDQTDVSAPSSGAAYVFARNNGNWVEQAFIKAAVPTHDLSSAEGFGGTVEIDGDTLAIVAPGHRSDATGVLHIDPERFGQNLGAVYLFE